LFPVRSVGEEEEGEGRVKRKRKEKEEEREGRSNGRSCFGFVVEYNCIFLLTKWDTHVLL